MKPIVTKIPTVLFLMLLAACSANKHAMKPESLAEQQPRAFSVNMEEYRIHAGDQLDIKFFYNPELNEQVMVRPDGYISLQLVHEVMTAGLTPAELSAVLRDRYSKDLAKPEITVIVRTFGTQRVFVDGEVVRPGLVAVTGSVTALQAISQAGGFKNTGKTGGVMIIRRDSENRPAAFSVDLQKAIDGTDPSRDIALRPFDIVYVPRTAIANANLWVSQYLNKMMPQIGLILSYPVGSGTIGVDLTNPWISE